MKTKPAPDAGLTPIADPERIGYSVPMDRLRIIPLALAFAAGVALSLAGRTDAAPVGEPPAALRTADTPAADKNAARRTEAIASATSIILALQEGPDKSEWPYEGVYRVRGQIPIGYRVGGTAICATPLLHGPGYRDDEQVRAAVDRAVAFIVSSTEHPLMSPEYDGGYDVRGWGYTYGLDLLLRHRRHSAKNVETNTIDRAIRFYIAAIQRTEIPGVGGWNYARPANQLIAPPSPFMTAPTLFALFQAAADGFEVDAEVVERALKSLTLSRLPSGSYVYAGKAVERPRDGRDVSQGGDGTPGAIGRTVAAETALFLAGRSTQAQLRASIESFFEHWDWLDKRRGQPGTHVPPYGVAPYYFYFAHLYTAYAIELLPPDARAEYRRRLEDLLFAVRLGDGGWNDRTFPRSANFGTAVASMALMMPDLPPPATWPTVAAQPAP
jgi:hypothetical protein